MTGNSLRGYHYLCSETSNKHLQALNAMSPFTRISLQIDKIVTGFTHTQKTDKYMSRELYSLLAYLDTTIISILSNIQYFKDETTSQVNLSLTKNYIESIDYLKV